MTSGTEKHRRFICNREISSNNGVEIIFGYECTNLILDGEECKGVYQKGEKEDEIYADNVIVANGRRGADWLENLCVEHGIAYETGDCGYRQE